MLIAVANTHTGLCMVQKTGSAENPKEFFCVAGRGQFRDGGTAVLKGTVGGGGGAHEPWTACARARPPPPAPPARN